MFIVVNPVAGSGRAGRIWPELRARAHHLGLRYECEVSRGPLTVTSFVRQALRAGADTIVAVGGDGTVNEAVNGFFLADERIRPGASLAVVPVGSSSDLARSLAIPEGLAALDTVMQGRTIELDVGRAAFADADGRPTVRYFLNNADVGMGARIAAGGGPLKRAGGRAAFFMASLAAVAQPEPWEGTVVIDGGVPEPVRVVTVVVALSPYTGGGMHIAPGAKGDDGWFDVVLINAMEPAELLLNLPRVYAGTHLSHPKVHRVQAHEVRVETVDLPPIEVDGEVAGAGSAEFRILPGEIKIHVGNP